MSKMGGLLAIGLLLVGLGLVGFAIPIFTTEHKENVAKVGDLSIQTTQSTPHVIPPIVSGGALVLGLIFIGAGVFRRA